MLRKFQAFVSATFLLILGLGAPARASDYHSPRTAALGGAGHAGPMLNDSIYLNPSFVSLVQTYAASVGYNTYSGEGTNPNDYHGMGYNVGIQDGRSELFQAGVGLTSREDFQILSIGASKQVVQQIGIGLGGKFVRARVLNADGFWEGSASSTWVINNYTQVSLTIDNLLETANGRANGFYREIVAGSKFNAAGAVQVYFDPHVVPSLNDSFGVELGFEVPVMKDFYARVGTFRNSLIPFAIVRGRGFAVGLGWIGPRISFDYGLEHALEPVSALNHVFGMTIFF